MHSSTGGRSARALAWGNPLAGVAFLLVVVLLGALCLASYLQVFTPAVIVYLHTDRAGSQMNERADVKLDGVLVGEVRHLTTTGQGAVLTLALDPAMSRHIPANVDARLLPKTLLGDRYVDLVAPARPAPPIRDGASIGQDHSRVAIELGQVFDNLLPLLRAVRPERLAATLNALATALEGRGAALGRNLDLTDRYLRGLNPAMPTIRADISGLADLASTYAAAAPDLLRMLRSLVTTNATIVGRRDALAAFLAGTAGFANHAAGFLEGNGDRIIRVGRVNLPTTRLLADFSPEYPCLAQGLAGYVPRISQAFAHGSFHITLEVVSPRAAYQPGEEPAWGHDPGPSCGLLPCPPSSQANPVPSRHFQDGTANRYGYSSDPTGDYKRAHPDWRRQFAELRAHCGQAGYAPPDMTYPPSSAGSALPSLFSTPAAAALPGTDSGEAGTVGEQRLVAALLDPGATSGEEAITTLLAGPVLRGSTVSQDDA